MSVPTNQTSTASSLKSPSQLTASESAGSLNEDVRTQQFEESYIFPLFSEISRVVVLPSIFCFLLIFIQILQSIAANMYIGNHHIWDSISSTPKIIRILSYSINFGVIDIMNSDNDFEDDSMITEDAFYNCYPCYVAVIAYFAVELLFLIYILYWYRKKRSFMKWSLYVAYFLLSILNPIIFTPACGIAGYAIWQIDSHRSTSSIVYFIISAIPALIILAFTIWNTNFTCHSVYISRNIDASWDSRIKNVFTITIGITSFLTPALNPFPGWFVFVGFVTGIVLNFYQLYLMYYLPLIKSYMNSIFQSICWLSIVGLILSIVNYFKDLSYIILIVVPLAVFIVFCILYSFFDKFKIKSALKKMDFNQEDYNEQDKKEFLESINLGSDSMAIFYIQVGISNLSPLCIDFSFMKYLINIRASPNILFFLIKLTAMIPAQMQFLSQLIATVTRTGAIFSIIQSYILYQSRKVNVIRQSVSSKEEMSEAKLLFKMSEETISLVRGFWGEISHTKSDISTASLRYFRNSSIRTSSSYLDALDQFPRSQKIYDQYIRFLIEAMGDYKSSIHYSKSLKMIELGHRMVHDYAFRSFANTFPRYLTENILDCHGMYLKNNEPQLLMAGAGQATELMPTANSLTNGSSSNCSSDFRNDDIASEIFDHSKLRVSLQEVIDKSSMKSLNMLRGLSIVSLVLILICFIVLILVVKSTVDNPYELMESNVLTSKIANSIEYASLNVGTRLLEYTYQTNTLGPLLAAQLSIKLTDLPNFPSVFNQPYIKLNMICEEIREQIHQVLDIIFKKPSKHIGEIEVLGHWDQTNYIEFYYDLTIARLSLRGGINLFLNQIYEVSSYQEIGIVTQKQLQLCITTCFNGYLIAKNFNSLFANVSQTGIDECERYSNTFDILTYIVSIVAVLLFFVVRIINFIYVMREFKSLSTILRCFNKDDMEASSKPIYLKSKDKLPTGTVHSAHDFSIEVFILPFIFLLVTADCIFVVVYSGSLNQDFFDSMADAFEWSNSGSQRSLTLMKLMVGVTIDHSSMSVLLNRATNESTTKIQDNIDIITKFQNQLDMEIIGKDDRFDNFYYNDRCSHIEGQYNYANFIDCISLSNKINLATSYFNMMKKAYALNDIFFTFEFAGIAYSIDKSIYNEFISFQDYLLTYAENISDEHNENIQMICIIGIIILVVLFIFENFFINMLYNSFAGFKQLIYTLPPVSVCQNRILMNFLSRMKNNDDLPSESEMVINASNMGIISINESLIIQTVNPAFIKMTGISSHKLLGQSITWLIPLPSDEKGNISLDKSPFYCAVDEMRKKNNNNAVRTVKIKIRKQDLETIHLSATLIQLLDDNDQFKGITIMMKSIEETVELKKKLEQEKLNTKQLLEVLIPSGAMNSVKGKKTPVLFKAEIATVMFVEITGISECISMMSPKGLMDILEQIYECISEALKKFDSVSMMRWENEMMFAVSGLFSHVGDYSKQASDTISFLLEITRQLEEINIQVNTDFHFRLGAHIGGPVMGFVQNPDVPCFNIRTASFKYLNYMKEMDCVDQIQATASTVKYLDANVFEATKNSTFEFEDGSEDVYIVKYKDGYKLPQEPVIEEEEEDISEEASKDVKENKVVKTNKGVKESKDIKEKNDDKENKNVKENKDTKEKNDDKGSKDDKEKNDNKEKNDVKENSDDTEGSVDLENSDDN